MSDVLPFVEAFGPTLQGEGPAAGRAATFLRFGGCNLSCSWCDSAYTWDGDRFDLREQIENRTADDLAELVAGLAGRVPVVVLTGGEPLLQQNREPWERLLRLLVADGRELHVETNGTLLPNRLTGEMVDTFIVSPKMPHAGLHRGRQDPRLHRGYGAFARTHRDAHLKVVVQGVEDVDATVRLAEEHGWPLDRVWVMPEGTTVEVLQHRWPAVAEAAARHGINASHRLHVLAWNDERGR